MRDKGLPLIGALGISALVGCGGNVVVDPPGGGPGGSGGEGGTPTVTTPTGTTTTGVDVPSYCLVFCQEIVPTGCVEGGLSECQQGCADAFEQFPMCQDELKGLYDCLLAEELGPNCDIGTSCDDEIEVFTVCFNGSSCTEYGCEGDPDGCACEGDCNGNYVETFCKDDGQGGFYCSCVVNGEGIGTCEGAAACGIFDSCCAELFASGE